MPSSASSVEGVFTAYSMAGLDPRIQYQYLNVTEGYIAGSNLGNYSQSYATVAVIVDQAGRELWRSEVCMRSRTNMQSEAMRAELAALKAKKLQQEAQAKAEHEALERWNALSDSQKLEAIVENYVAEHGPRPDPVLLGWHEEEAKYSSAYVPGLGTIKLGGKVPVPDYDNSARDAWDDGYTKATGLIYETGETVEAYNQRMDRMLNYIADHPSMGFAPAEVEHIVVPTFFAGKNQLITNVPSDPYGFKSIREDFNARSAEKYAKFTYELAHMRNPSTGVKQEQTTFPSPSADIRITDLVGYSQTGRIKDAKPGSSGKYLTVRSGTFLSVNQLKILGIDTASIPPGAFMQVKRVQYLGAKPWDFSEKPANIIGTATFANPFLE